MTPQQSAICGRVSKFMAMEWQGRTWHPGIIRRVYRDGAWWSALARTGVSDEWAEEQMLRHVVEVAAKYPK